MARKDVVARKEYNRRYSAENREKLNAYERDQRQKDPEKARARERDKQQRISKEIAVLKQHRGCDVCGYCKNTSALHFHHRDPTTKEFAIGHGISKSYSRARIDAEIAKCDLVCGNCHAEIEHPGQEVD